MLLAGCGGPGSFGPGLAESRLNADQMFGALALRFTDVQRDAKFAAGRGRIARHIATPSAIWSDTSVWTAEADPEVDSVRVLTVVAGTVDGHYQFSARPDAPMPGVPGAARHEIDLDRLPDGDFRWRTRVDFAIGTIRAEDVAGVLRAALAAGEGGPEPELRRRYADAFPRATEVLGRLFTLDTLRAFPRADGATVMEIALTVHPDGVRPTLPAFADYLEKYIQPARYRFLLTDQHGARWLEIEGYDGHLAIRLRQRDGRLAPLDGPLRPMPDSLVLTTDAMVKFKIFTVGFTHLVSEFTLAEGPHQRGWTMRFREEPDWHLPLAVQHLIRAPLRRPFAGEGALMRFWVEDSAGGGAQTTSSREVRFAVHESAIIRFLGALVFSAMDDFEGRSEVEEALYNLEVWNAFRADVREAVMQSGSAPPAAASPAPENRNAAVP